MTSGRHRSEEKSSSSRQPLGKPVPETSNFLVFHQDDRSRRGVAINSQSCGHGQSRKCVGGRGGKAGALLGRYRRNEWAAAHSHMGALTRSKDSRQFEQIGIRLALVKVDSHMRQGAGKTPQKTTHRERPSKDPRYISENRWRGATAKLRMCLMIRDVSSKLGIGRSGSGRCPQLQEPLLLLFLAGDAITRPRDGLEALLLELLMAGDALTESLIVDAPQSFVDQLEQRRFSCVRPNRNSFV